MASHNFKKKNLMIFFYINSIILFIIGIILFVLCIILIIRNDENITIEIALLSITTIFVIGTGIFLHKKYTEHKKKYE